MRKLIAQFSSALLAGAALMTAEPAFAAPATPAGISAPPGAPSYDPAVRPPGPGDLVWKDLAELEKQPDHFEDTQMGPVRDARTRAPSAVISGPAGVRCTIDTGSIYKRSSGWIYPNGSVGGHPATRCTIPMVSINQSTTLYKTVWWGLQRVAGPFNSFNQGQASLTQTSPEVVCQDLRSTTFRMIVRSTGVFPQGTSGTASAYEEATLPCGTNP